MKALPYFLVWSTLRALNCTLWSHCQEPPHPFLSCIIAKYRLVTKQSAASWNACDLTSRKESVSCIQSISTEVPYFLPYFHLPYLHILPCIQRVQILVSAKAFPFISWLSVNASVSYPFSLHPCSSDSLPLRCHARLLKWEAMNGWAIVVVLRSCQKNFRYTCSPRLVTLQPVTFPSSRVAMYYSCSASRERWEFQWRLGYPHRSAPTMRSSVYRMPHAINQSIHPSSKYYYIHVSHPLLSVCRVVSVRWFQSWQDVYQLDPHLSRLRRLLCWYTERHGIGISTRHRT